MYLKILNQEPADFIVELMLLLMIGAVIRNFIIVSRKKHNLHNQYDYLSNGVIHTFHFFGSLSTMVEVIGLGLIAMLAGNMTLFNAVTRFGLWGSVEIFMTYLFINQVFKSLQKAAEKKPDESKAQITFWEKTLCIIKNSPLFLAGVCVTYSIFLLYLESKGSVQMSVSGEIWKPWSLLTVEGIPYSLNDIRPELSAFLLIFATPTFSFLMMVFIMVRDSDELLEAIESHTTTVKHTSNNRQDRSRGRRDRNERSDRSNRQDSRDDGSDDDDSHREDNNGGYNTGGIVKVDKFREMIDEVCNFYNDYNSNGKLHDLDPTIFPDSLDSDDIFEVLMKYSGINPDLKGLAIYPNTSNEVKTWLNSQKESNKLPQDHKSAPNEFFKKQVYPIIKGQSDSASDLTGYEGILAIQKDIDDLRDSLEKAQNELEKDKQSLSVTSDKDRASILKEDIRQKTLEIQNLETAIKSYGDEGVKADKVEILYRLFIRGIESVGYSA
jgi:hypothetical protein